jgi:DNA primase
MALLQRHLPGPFKPTGGSNILTRCPFHKDGEEKRPSFSVNIDLGVFHCFTCHEAGNLKQLLRSLNVSRFLIDEELKILRPLISKSFERLRREKQYAFVHKDPFEADFVLPEALLGVYEFMPTQLVGKGFSPDVLYSLEIGFDRTNQRITYPLRDLYGNLAGISGGATLPDQFPKYKVYQGKRKTTDGSRWIGSDFGTWFDDEFPNYRCENHDFLWNFHQVYPRVVGMSDPSVRVYVTEGFKAAMWLIQHGYLNTTALMGSYISARQQQMLHRLGCTVVLCLDNDEAGRRATFNVGDLLWRPLYGRVEVMNYPHELDNSQPDDHPKEVLDHMLGNTISFVQYVEQLRKGQQ